MHRFGIIGAGTKREVLMNTTTILGAFALCTLWAAWPSQADELPARTQFAAPQRIAAGDAILGQGRMYPSPAMHDVNGDGKADLVVADLFGRVTVALRTDDGWAKETPLLDRDGKPLKFHNW
jgi:hypothetical protein